MDISIVIPVYNALPLAQQCLESVYLHGSKLVFEIIVVDNGSAPDVPQWLAEQERLHANLRHLRYEEPLGFARSVNAGAAAASGDVLIVLNSDTIVTAGWMDELHRALMADPSLGAITPATNHAGEPAQMDFGTVDLSAAKALAIRSARPMAPDILYLPQRLTFFCVALRRETWLAFDGLDETYRVGNFEDDDLCLRLRVAGYRLGVALHVFVYHHNNATFSANKIKHNDWMAHNATVFAAHARAFAEAAEPSAPRWPRRSEPDVSVVILKSAEGSLERTLRSLGHQTIVDFEVVLPGSDKGPTRTWIAYVTQGDILYPFHLEALREAMDRNGAEAIFADAWVAGESTPAQHPDATKLVRIAPSLLAGWMHHASLDRERLWEQTTPRHWPRLTWEMARRPTTDTAPQRRPQRSAIDGARSLYRRMVPLEVRLKLDAAIRKLIGRPAMDPAEAQMRQLATQLDQLRVAGTDAGRFAATASLPAIVMFNGVPWNSLIQRQHHFARGLAQLGHPVLWIEPALAPARNWWTGRALPLAAPGIQLLRLPAAARDIYGMSWSPAVLEVMVAALQQVAAAYAMAPVVSLVNYQRWQPLATAMQQRCGWKIAYDCLDDQRAMADVYQTPYSKFEDDLIGSADVVVTSSAVLHARMAQPPQNKESILLHNAADFDLFSSAIAGGHLQHLPRPIVGFFGALADWLDAELVHAAAARFPEWSFVYIGPHTFSRSEIEVQWMRSIHLPNITVLPQMDPRPLAAHLAEFDVCTVPFLDIAVARSMNPVKLYEYLAAGKPAVSRDLPEVRHLLDGESHPEELVMLYTTPEEFFARLQEALADDSEARTARRREFARRNDWSARVDVLSAELNKLA